MLNKGEIIINHKGDASGINNLKNKTSATKKTSSWNPNRFQER